MIPTPYSVPVLGRPWENKKQKTNHTNKKTANTRESCREQCIQWRSWMML